MTHDDPRITAWALGEYDAPERATERAEVEAALAADPGLRAEAEAMRASAAVLRGGLEAEAVPALDPAHRGAIEAALRVPSATRPPVRLVDHAGLGALAATLLLAIGFGLAGATGGIEFEAQGNPRAAELHVVDGDVGGIGDYGTFSEMVPAPVADVFTAAGGDGTLGEFAPASGAGPGGGKGGIINSRSTTRAYSYGLGGGGGGGGHQVRGARLAAVRGVAPGGAAGGIQPRSAKTNDGKDFFFLDTGGGVRSNGPARMRLSGNITINGTLRPADVVLGQRVLLEDVSTGLDDVGGGLDPTTVPLGGVAHSFDWSAT